MPYQYTASARAGTVPIAQFAFPRAGAGGRAPHIPGRRAAKAASTGEASPAIAWPCRADGGRLRVPAASGTVEGELAQCEWLDSAQHAA